MQPVHEWVEGDESSKETELDDDEEKNSSG